MSKLRRLATIYDFDNIEGNEDYFDGIQEKHNDLQKLFYNETDHFLTKEEQDCIWNNTKAYTLSEEKLKTLITLLHENGLMKHYLEKFICYKGSHYSYIEAMIAGLNYDYSLMVRCENLIMDYNIDFDIINMCYNGGFTYNDLQNLRNLSEKELDMIKYQCETSRSVGVSNDLNILKAAIKPNYSEAKRMIILDGFKYGLSVDQIIAAIKKKLPKEQW